MTGAATDFGAITQPAPFVSFDGTVPKAWLDYNGHMTEARYLECFGLATDRTMLLLGVDDAYLAAGGSFFTAETHICHLAEARLGDALYATTQIMGGGGKTMHLFHRLWRGDDLLATGEHLLIHVSLQTRRAAPPVAPVSERLAQMVALHAGLPRPEQAGRAIGR